MSPSERFMRHYYGASGYVPPGSLMPKHDYDTTLARIAGNIAAGLVTPGEAYAEPATHRDRREAIAAVAVDLARLIVAEVRATEPPRIHTDIGRQDEGDDLAAEQAHLADETKNPR